jgi:hypothetical protein
MAQLESDDMDQLMPNLQQQARQHCSPANTAALRQYVKVISALEEGTKLSGNHPPLEAYS